ncbi:MAG: ribosomal protein S18-alanine N-acetyltransferase [Eubacteriales bacterium]|nr:ribosomal protein S18-alanine N-acetyltransferase [Eubacteriales bacterium]
MQNDKSITGPKSTEDDIEFAPSRAEDARDIADIGADILISPSHVEDARDIADIEGICFSDPWSEKSVREHILLDFSVNVVARHSKSGKTVGYVLGQRLYDDIEVLRVATLPEYRLRGIGKRMLCEFLRLSDFGSECRCFIEVRESNEAAISLYLKLGFSKTGIRKNYYIRPRENAIILKKQGDG